MHIKVQPSRLYLSASRLTIAALICYLGCLPILTCEALHSWRSLRSPSSYLGSGYDAPMMAASASSSATASAAASVASHLPGRGGYSAMTLPLGKRKPKWAASFGNSFKAKAHNLSTRLFHENPNYGHNFMRNHAQYTEHYSRTYTTSRASSGIIHQATTTYFEPIKGKNSRKNARAPIRRQRSKADKNRRPPPSSVAAQLVQDPGPQVEPLEARMNQENTFDQGMLESSSAAAASSSGSQRQSISGTTIHEHGFQSDATNEQESSQVFDKQTRSEENVSDLDAGLEEQRTLREDQPISIESKARPIPEITRSEYESALAGEQDSESRGLHDEAQPEGLASETIEAETSAADPEFRQPLTAKHEIREAKNLDQIKEDLDSRGEAVNVAYLNDAPANGPVETLSSNADDSPNEIATGLEEGISESLPVADSDQADHLAPSSVEFPTVSADSLNSDATDDSTPNQEVAQEVRGSDNQNHLVSDADRENINSKITSSRLSEQLGQSDSPMHEDESVNKDAKSGSDIDDSSPNEAVKKELDSPESSQTDPEQEDKAEGLNGEIKEDAVYALGEVANLSDGVYEVAKSDGDRKPVEETESDNTEGVGDNFPNEFEKPGAGESSSEDQHKADKAVGTELSKENEEQNNEVDTSNQDNQNSGESNVADRSAIDDIDREKIPEKAKSVSGHSDNNSSTGKNVAMSEQSDAQQAEANENNTSAESNNRGTTKNKRNRRKHRKSNKKDLAKEDQSRVSLEETKEVENRRRSKKTSAVTEETDEITSEKSTKKLEAEKSHKKERRNRRNRRRKDKNNKQDAKNNSVDEKQQENTHLSKSHTSGGQNKMGSSESSDHPALPPEEASQSSSDRSGEQSQKKTDARDKTNPSDQQEETSETKTDHEEDNSPAIADKPSRRYSYLRNGKAFRSTSDVNEMLMRHLGKNHDATEVKNKPVAKSESNDNKENVSPTSDEIKAELASMPLPPMLDDNSLVKSKDQRYGTGKTNTNRNRVTKLNHRISIKDEDWSPKRELKSKEGGANVEEDGEYSSTNERKRVLREKSLPLAKKLSRSIDKVDQLLASAKSNGKIKPIPYKSTHKKVKVGDR